MENCFAGRIERFLDHTSLLAWIFHGTSTQDGKDSPPKNLNTSHIFLEFDGHFSGWFYL